MTRLWGRLVAISGAVMIVIVIGALSFSRWIDSPQLAYLREYSKIHLMDIERRVSFPLVMGLVDIPVNLGWSPDGRYLSYARLLRQEGYVLYLVDLQGNHIPQPRVTLSSSALMPTWSPDSRQFAYVPEGVSNQLCIHTITAPTTQPDDCYPLDLSHTPDWSPDGAQLAVLAPRSQQILLFDPTTQTQTVLLDAPEIGVMANVRWSHQGDSLVFTQNGLDLIADLYWVSVSDALAQPDYLARQLIAGSIFGVRWSPDDRWLAYQTIGNQNDLFVYEVASGERHSLMDDVASEGAVEWANNGKLLVYVSNKRGFPEVYFQAFAPDTKTVFPTPPVPIDVTVSMYGIAPRP